MVNNIWVA